MASILSLPFLLAHHIVTYLYPLYASYKAIAPVQEKATRPVRPPFGNGNERTEMADLETWLMYWSVVGTMTLIEAWAEWSWSWLPFYGVFKLAFTLWLVLPQTQGATILYSRYLGPFLQSHEDDIDVALSSAKVQATRAAANGFASLWQRLRGAILGAAYTVDPTTTPSEYDGRPAPPAPQHNMPAAPPTMHDPVSGPANQLVGMLKHYGPLAAAGLVGVMDRAAAAAAEASEKAKAESSGTTRGQSDEDDSDGSTGDQRVASGDSAVRKRRRAELERQLDEMGAGSSGGSSSVRTRSAAAKGVATTATSSRLRVNKPANSSDLSSDEGSGKGSRDLSGSYQLVDQDDEQANDTAVPATPSSGGGWTSWMSRR